MPDTKLNDRRSEHVIEHLDLGAIIPNPRNRRTHTPKQIAQIAASIAEFGFTSPILVDRNNMVIAGSARFAAAKNLGFQKLPVIRLKHLTPEQVKAYVITDNKLSANAGWDDDLLRAELEQLLAMDLDFDVTITCGLRTTMKVALRHEVHTQLLMRIVVDGVGRVPWSGIGYD